MFPYAFILKIVKIVIFFCRFYLERKETTSVEIVEWYKSIWRIWIWGQDQRSCVDFWKSNRLGIANWVNWDFWNRWKPTKNRHSNRHAITTRSKFTLTISYIPLYFHFWYFEIFDRRTLIWRVVYYGVKRRNIWQLLQGMDGSRSLNLFIRTQIRFWTHSSLNLTSKIWSLAKDQPIYSLKCHSGCWIGCFAKTDNGSALSENFTLAWLTIFYACYYFNYIIDYFWHFFSVLQE